MKNWTQKRVFAMCGAALLMLTTEVVSISYVWENLHSGWRWPIVLGLIVVAHVLLWATWWYSKEDEPPALVKTAFVVAFGVSAVMVFNSAMILTVRTNDKKAKDTRAETARIEADKADQEHRAKIAQQQSEIELMKGLDPRVAKELIKAREQAQQLEAEAKKRKELQEAAAPKAAVEQVNSEDFQDIVDFARWYCKSVVFGLPLFIGLVGEAALAYIFAFRRKAWTEQQPATGRAPVSGPMPVPSPNPSGPMPVRTPNPDLAAVERIRMGRDGGPGKN